MKYKRILLKLSGEALSGNGIHNLDHEILEQYAKEIKAANEVGVEIAIVIGGGNIMRGADAEQIGIDRVQGDYMGMLATLINGMAIQSSLEKEGIYTRLQSGIRVDEICEPFIKRRAVRHLEKGRVVIFAAGTGNPYFTTDSAASLRAIEIEADVVLKGTKVDGIYNSDPMLDPKAIKFSEISFSEAIAKGLKVMDITAFALCQENEVPIIVFDMNKKGNLLKIVEGEKIGTLVSK